MFFENVIKTARTTVAVASLGVAAYGLYQLGADIVDDVAERRAKKKLKKSASK